MMSLRKTRSLQLDFRGGRPGGYWAGWALLAMAVAFAIDLGASYFSLRGAVSQKEDSLAVLSHELRISVPSRPVSKEEVTMARETIQRIALPWDRLFGALEAAASTASGTGAGTGSEPVALIAIEPDPQAGTVLISGEGRDYAAALGYLQQLRQSKALSAVHLVKHEVQNTPGRPVAFTVSAAWSR